MPKRSKKLIKNKNINTQYQNVSIVIGDKHQRKRQRKTPKAKSDNASNSRIERPPQLYSQGYISHTPSLTQMNRLVPQQEITPYQQVLLNRLGNHVKEIGTQAGIAMPIWWNNPQQVEAGAPINLLDNLSKVSSKSSQSVALGDDIEDIVHAEEKDEVIPILPSLFKNFTDNASSSPSSLSAYPTDDIVGTHQNDVAMSSAQFDALHEQQNLAVSKNDIERKNNLEEAKKRREERIKEDLSIAGLPERYSKKTGELLNVSRTRQHMTKEAKAERGEYIGRPKGAPRKK